MLSVCKYNYNTAELNNDLKYVIPYNKALKRMFLVTQQIDFCAILTKLFND